MAFEEVEFPPSGFAKEGYPHGGGPETKTGIIELDSGAEERVAHWDGARHSYDLSYMIRKVRDLMAVREFYYAMRGPLVGFRYKDPMDNTSNDDGRTAPTKDDQSIGSGDASTLTFQLKKSYVAGSITRTRNITKPESGTVLIAFDGVNQPTGWTVNTTTGIVTFASAPGSGVAITAGYEFRVPVRFLDDTVMKVSVQGFEAGGIPAIPLIEILETSSCSDEFMMGGSKDHGAITGSISLTRGEGRLHAFSQSTAGLKLFLPDATDEPDGGPHFLLQNDGSTSLDLKTYDDSTLIITIPTSSQVEVWLRFDAAATKTWVAW